jgi:hypothetical protein
VVVGRAGVAGSSLGVTAPATSSGMPSKLRPGDPGETPGDGDGEGGRSLSPPESVFCSWAIRSEMADGRRACGAPSFC